MSNEIKYSKTFTLGGEKSDYIPETCKEIIQDILKIPAVSVKGHRDELIEYDLEAEEPICIWRVGHLETMDQVSLGILRTFAEKRRDFLTKQY